jgi:outer membrane receptor for Fe3+-dicitrate
MRAALLLALAGAGLAMAVLAAAQERPGNPPDGVIQLPPVRILAPARLPGEPLPLDHVPGSVQIISGDTLRGRGVVTVQDALVGLPGVTLGDEQATARSPT